jgi:hypothetical protein
MYPLTFYRKIIDGSSVVRVNKASGPEANLSWVHVELFTCLHTHWASYVTDCDVNKEAEVLRCSSAVPS